MSHWLKTELGLVIGYLEVVTTNNYNSVTDIHTTKHSTLLASVHLHQSSRIYNTGTIKVSLNHTLSISLYYSTHEFFKSHVKSSQADFLYSSSTTNFPWLSPTENGVVVEPNEFCHLYSRVTDTHHRKHMPRDHHPPLRDVTADTESTVCSIVACWTVSKKLLPDNALIKSFTIYKHTYIHTYITCITYTSRSPLKWIAFYATCPFFSDSSTKSTPEISYSRQEEDTYGHRWSLVSSCDD
jgi:hypothetical protein